ncbi:hypothetical protein ACFLYU_02855 [Candidatus Dependentiae bacterium]
MNFIGKKFILMSIFLLTVPFLSMDAMDKKQKKSKKNISKIEFFAIAKILFIFTVLAMKKTGLVNSFPIRRYPVYTQKCENWGLKCENLFARSILQDYANSGICDERCSREIRSYYKRNKEKDVNPVENVCDAKRYFKSKLYRNETTNNFTNYNKYSNLCKFGRYIERKKTKGFCKRYLDRKYKSNKRKNFKKIM